MSKSYPNTSSGNNSNRNRIFKKVLEGEKISRQTLSTDLNLSMPTVNLHVQRLLDDGLIKESGVISSTGAGRKATAIVLNSNARVSIGLDITQHHVTVVLVNLNGEVLERKNMEYSFLNQDASYQFLNSYVERIIQKNHFSTDQILGLGISLPAIITEDGNGLDPTALQLLDGAEDFYERFEKYSSLPFKLYNDANSGGFAEIYHRGNISRMIYLSLKHSIGGAVIEDNKIVGGNNCRCGEFGHMTLVPNGIPCHCGNLGCANCYCSPDILAEHANGSLDAFFNQVDSGNYTQSKVLDEYLEYLSILIRNIYLAFDCDVVIGGDISFYLEKYLGVLRDKVAKKTHFNIMGGKEITCGGYPFDASAIGAALFNIYNFVNNV